MIALSITIALIFLLLPILPGIIRRLMHPYPYKILLRSGIASMKEGDKKSTVSTFSLIHRQLKRKEYHEFISIIKVMMKVYRVDIQDQGVVLEILEEIEKDIVNSGRR